MLDIDLSSIATRSELPDFEMFLMPEGWQIDNQLVSETVRSVTYLVDNINTRGFMERIARDATTIT